MTQPTITITITETVVTAMLRIGVSFNMLSNASSYEVTATATGHPTLTATGTSTPILLPQAVPNVTYSVTVTAKSGTTVLATSPAVTVSTSIVTTNGAILRQALSDEFMDASLAINGRTLTVFRNRYDQPKTVYDDDNIGRATPLLEIAHPTLIGTGDKTAARIVESYKIDCAVIEAIRPGCHDEALESAQTYRDLVRYHLETLDTVLGDWKLVDGEFVFNDQIVAQRFILTITRQFGTKRPYTI